MRIMPLKVPVLLLSFGGLLLAGGSGLGALPTLGFVIPTTTAAAWRTCPATATLLSSKATPTTTTTTTRLQSSTVSRSENVTFHAQSSLSSFADPTTQISTSSTESKQEALEGTTKAMARPAMVNSNEKDPPTPSSPSSMPGVTELQSLSHLLHYLDNTEPDQLCIVKYWASYCKVCQRTKQIFGRMARKESDEARSISSNVNLKFATAEIKKIGIPSVKRLGVTKTPWVQIYRNGVCVASFSTGGAHNFKGTTLATLMTCRERTEEEWRTFQDEHEMEVQIVREALEELRETAAEEEEKRRTATNMDEVELDRILNRLKALTEKKD